MLGIVIKLYFYRITILAFYLNFVILGPLLFLSTTIKPSLL